MHIVRFHSRCDCSLTAVPEFGKLCARQVECFAYLFLMLSFSDEKRLIRSFTLRNVTLYGVPTAFYRATHKGVYGIDKNSR